MIGSIKEYIPDEPFVFVSYSKKDKDIVWPIVDRLYKNGINVWMDKELIKSAGECWNRQVFSVLGNGDCRAVLFMISENSLISSAVFSELMWSQHGEPVVDMNDDEPLKIIPINVSKTWHLSKANHLNKWINNLTKENKNLKLNDDDYNILRENPCIEQKYYDKSSLGRLEHAGLIAKNIFKQVLNPLGGNNITTIYYSDIDSIILNIPDECKIGQLIESSNTKNIIEDADQNTSIPAGSRKKVENINSVPDNIQTNDSQKCTSFHLKNSKKQNITGSKPAGMQIGDKFLRVNSWADLYIRLLQELGKKNFEKLEKAARDKEPLTKNGWKPFVVYEHERKEYFNFETRLVMNNIYAETHGSAKVLLDRTHNAAVKLGEDPDSITIYLDVQGVVLPNESEEESHPSKETAEDHSHDLLMNKPVSIYNKNYNIDQEPQIDIKSEIEIKEDIDLDSQIIREKLISLEQENFKKWATDSSKLKPNTLINYLSSLARLNVWIKDNGISTEDLWLLDGLKEIKELENTLKGRTDFQIFNKNSHNRFSSALALFIKYKSCKDCSSASSEKNNIVEKKNSKSLCPDSPSQSNFVQKTETSSNNSKEISLYTEFEAYLSTIHNPTVVSNHLKNIEFIDSILKRENFPVQRIAKIQNISEAESTVNEIKMIPAIAKRNRHGKIGYTLNRYINFLKTKEAKEPQEITLDPAAQEALVKKEKTEFRNWMIQNNEGTKHTIKKYATAIGTVNDWIKENGISEKDLLTLNLDEIETIESSLLKNEDFCEWNNYAQQVKTSALQKFKKYKMQQSELN